MVITVEAVDSAVALAAAEVIVPIAVGVGIVAAAGAIAYGVSSIATALATDSDYTTVSAKVDPQDPLPRPFPTFDWADPTKPLVGTDGKEWEWKGNGPPSAGKGNWTEPDNGPGRLNPDLDHLPPEQPHWDFTNKGTPGKWKIYGDRTIVRAE